MSDAFLFVSLTIPGAIYSPICFYFFFEIASCIELRVYLNGKEVFCSSSEFYSFAMFTCKRRTDAPSPSMIILKIPIKKQHICYK